MENKQEKQRGELNAVCMGIEQCIAHMQEQLIALENRVGLIKQYPAVPIHPGEPKREDKKEYTLSERLYQSHEHLTIINSRITETNNHLDTIV